jgi:hypothetical protein
MLLPLHPLGVQSLVLVREIVAILTLAAGEDDFVSGHCWYCSKERETGNGKRETSWKPGNGSRFPVPVSQPIY